MNLVFHNFKASSFNIHVLAFFIYGNNSIHAFTHMFTKETNGDL